jgi:proteasome lid subunit RPN8/RPN11
METQSANGMTRWTAAECPFAIEYSTRVLDDVRLAVMDAFFSLPRGGAEIGGILLGRQEKGRIVAVDAMPIACEHAFGPSFVLSPRDHEKLAELLAATARNPHSKVVGWYHSHTRSEIFLSPEDIEIHNRFFPEPWQVALVLKPHTFQPMRAGFFFREANGSIHSEAAYHEFLLEPLPMRPAPAPGAPEATPLFRNPRDMESGNGPVVNVAAVVEAEPKAPEPEPVPAPELPPPAFLAAASAPPPSRRWMTWAVAALLGTALGAWGWHTRAEWLPKVQAMANAKPDEKLGLSSVDRDGQLQVQWNGNSRAALASTSASLLIVDGEKTHTVELGRPHVLTGSFTYARQSGKVDVTLVLPQSGGKEIREATIFAGDPPGHQKAAPAPPEPAPAPAKSSAVAELTAENARLRQENAVQVERNKRLEKAMEELRKVIQREEQRKRLELQSRDAAK